MRTCLNIPEEDLATFNQAGRTEGFESPSKAAREYTYDCTLYQGRGMRGTVFVALRSRTNAEYNVPLTASIGRFRPRRLGVSPADESGCGKNRQDS